MVGSPSASLPRILITSTPATGRTDTVFASVGFMAPGQRLFFQRSCEKVADPLLRIRRSLGIVPLPIDRILESMASVGVDLEVHRIPVRFHLLFEFVDCLRRDPLVLSAKIPQHLGVNGFYVAVGFG